MTHPTRLPLEDELGDVLEKAMRRAGCDAAELAALSGVAEGRIRDAVDYRSDLEGAEICRLARVLRLNEVGLCALGAGAYPLPEIGPLPFDLWPLRMPHGIGVANAYLVAEHGAERGLLFDAGAGPAALEAVWPSRIRRVDAVFLTHVETEHAGGLCGVVERFGISAAFVPADADAPCGRPVTEGAAFAFGPFNVAVFSTPGHASAHNCYEVRMGRGPGLLACGDLVFAGSAGGGYFDQEASLLHLHRLLRAVPPSTVLAPGHGPLTTVENELRYNPFFA